MKIRRFERIDSVNAFLKREREKEIIVKRISIAPHNPDIFYVFYEDRENLLKAELEELKEVKRIVDIIEKDEKYKMLKNLTQRKIYLLEKHNITSGMAIKAIDYINMRRLFGDEIEKS